MTRSTDSQRRRSDLLIAGGLTGLLASAAAAQIWVPEYELFDLGSLGGPASVALGTNGHGDVVGWAETEAGQIHGFHWQGGEMIDLGVLGTRFSEARDINAAEQIVGVSQRIPGEMRAVYWFDGTIHDLSESLVYPLTLPPDQYPRLSEANAINDDGQIVAVGTIEADDNVYTYLLTPLEPEVFDPYDPRYDYVETGFLPQRAASQMARLVSSDEVGVIGEEPDSESALTPCPWDCSNGDGEVGIHDFLAVLGTWGQVGAPCDFDGNGVGINDFLKILGNWGPCPLAALPQPQSSLGFGINGVGHVVGNSADQAFLFLGDEELTGLEVSLFRSQANAINDFGIAVGWLAGPSGGSHATLWSMWMEGEHWPLSTPQGWISEALDVNDATESVGWAADNPIGSESVAMLWRGLQATNLDQVTAIPEGPVFWDRLEQATAIDDGHRIVGYGRTLSGVARAFILVPIDYGNDTAE